MAATPVKNSRLFCHVLRADGKQVSGGTAARREQVRCLSEHRAAWPWSWTLRGWPCLASVLRPVAAAVRTLALLTETLAVRSHSSSHCRRCAVTGGTWLTSCFPGLNTNRLGHRHRRFRPCPHGHLPVGDETKPREARECGWARSPPWKQSVPLTDTSPCWAPRFIEQH